MFTAIRSIRRLPPSAVKVFRPSAAVFSTQPPKAVPLSQLSESFASGTSATYLEQMHEKWQENPGSVHVSWDVYFRNVEQGLPPGQAFQAPPSLNWVSVKPGPAVPQVPGQVPTVGLGSTAQAPQYASANLPQGQLQDSIRATLLVRSYQIRGHTQADLDPLKLSKPKYVAELDPATYGFKESDLEREVFVGDETLAGLMKTGRWIKLKELIAALKRIYCSRIGIEYTHIQDHAQKKWLQERLETLDLHQETTVPEKQAILQRLAEADLLELFLATKYATTKRFGLDGAESFVPGMEAMIDRAAELGVESVVIGMAHRGRINVMANVMNKPLAAIFHEFEGGNVADAEGVHMTGDVKYHLGTSTDIETKHGRKLHLSLVANPSHLEAVGPVVEGKARAKQFFKKDHTRSQVLAIQVHGDAAFAGQGVVYETLDLSGLDSYTTGGTIHVVVNNQIGFTTDPVASRGTREYCTDVGKCNSAPIFHVNADDPDAVVYVMELAAEFRQTFKRDVVVDLIGYRRFGHNENDQPMYTQPLMYKQITKQPRTLDLYKNTLIAQGVISQKDWDTMKNEIWERYEAGHRAGKEYKTTIADWLESRWTGFKGTEQQARIKTTGVPMDQLISVGNKLTQLPENFKLHRGIKKILEQKAEMITTGQKVDWATAEALAFGTLLLEGNHVRLSGQDVERGTFSHRHAVLHDQDTGATFAPLKHLSPTQAEFTVSNSSLSEFAVMGFELGYSMENPNSLVLWEAQFGDFANGAQIIIDQFLCSGEQKWMRQCGLVLLLPHGFEGQGPEHSSARIERWLQLSDSDPDDASFSTDIQLKRHNWAVVYPTTSANYFHVLRRQIHRSFRKPLVVFTPKYYLKHQLSASALHEFDDQGNDTGFTLVYPELEPTLLVAPEKVRKVVFCTGKVYFDLLQYRREKGVNDVALVRVEQLAPFPFDAVREQGALYPNAKIAWAQEEPKNAGAWNWIAPHLTTALQQQPVYIGRKPSAAAATGSNAQHASEFSDLMRNTIEL